MKGQESSQAIGYIAEGLFRDQAERLIILRHKEVMSCRVISVIVI